MDRVLKPQPGDTLAFQRALAAFNRERLTPTCGMLPRLAHENAWRLRERAFVLDRSADVAARAAEAPREAEAFVRWFEALERTGPGQNDPLFPWLAQQASLPQMTWFLAQEAAGEAGFDDLVAMTQVKLPVRAKLEMARVIIVTIERLRNCRRVTPMVSGSGGTQSVGTDEAAGTKASERPMTTARSISLPLATAAAPTSSGSSLRRDASRLSVSRDS
jgi:hypothetical protein